MSVHITFEPGKGSGLVAEGSILWDAARRLGVPIPAECNGRGECDSCVVVVKEGADLLSTPSTTEHTQLGGERLAEGRRLACQARVERSGDVVLLILPVVERAKTIEDTADEIRKKFRELPLGGKIKRLAEFEAVSAFEALTTIASLPFTVGEMVLDVVANFGRKRERGRKTQRTDAQRTDVKTEVTRSEPLD